MMHTIVGQTRRLLLKVKCVYAFLSLLDHSLPEGRTAAYLGKSPFSTTTVLDTDGQRVNKRTSDVDRPTAEWSVCFGELLGLC